jgi:hypothetical protein
MDAFRSSRSTRLFLTAAVLLALAACGDSSGADPRVPARLDVVSGDAQSGTVGAELPNPLVVKVVDDDGKPVRDQLVNFRVVSGGGSVFAGSALTNKDGVAQERWTLGTVALDSQKVEARAVDSSTGTGVVFAVFRATAAPAAPASLTALAPAAKVAFAGAAVADSPAVKVVDHFGNPVPGVTVTWTAGAGSAVSPATATATGATGVARAAWILPPRVDTVYTAAAMAGALGSAQFTATAQVPPNAVLEKISGDNQTVQAGTAPQPFTARLRLLDGRGIQGAAANFNGTPMKTDGNGVVTLSSFPAQTQAGTYGVPVQISGGPSAVFTLNVAAAPATDIYIYSQPTYSFFEQWPYVGDQVQAVLGARDVFGNPAPGVPITFRVVQGGGSVSPSPAVTSGPQGLAEVTFTLGGTPGSQLYMAYLPGNVDSVLVSFPSRAGALPVTVQVQPGSVQLGVGARADLRASGTDRFGNTLPVQSPRTRFEWTSRNPGVTTVSSLDISSDRASVRGVAPGSTWVVATYYRDAAVLGRDSAQVVVQ